MLVKRAPCKQVCLYSTSWPWFDFIALVLSATLISVVFSKWYLYYFEQELLYSILYCIVNIYNLSCCTWCKGLQVSCGVQIQQNQNRKTPPLKGTEFDIVQNSGLCLSRKHLLGLWLKYNSSNKIVVLVVVNMPSLFQSHCLLHCCVWTVKTSSNISLVV